MGHKKRNVKWEEEKRNYRMDRSGGCLWPGDSSVASLVWLLKRITIISPPTRGSLTSNGRLDTTELVTTIIFSPAILPTREESLRRMRIVISDKEEFSLKGLRKVYRL